MTIDFQILGDAVREALEGVTSIRGCCKKYKIGRSRLTKCATCAIQLFVLYNLLMSYVNSNALLHTCLIYLRAIRYEVNPELTPARRGRPPAVSQSVIDKARAVALERDLSKDSFTCNSDVMELVNDLMREEQEELGHNPRAPPPSFCRSTDHHIVKLIVPVNVPSGSVQNASRQKALW